MSHLRQQMVDGAVHLITVVILKECLVASVVHYFFLVENIRWQRSGSCQTVVRQSSSSRQAVVRQSSGSCQAVIRQLSDSCQAAVRQSSGSHQAVFRQCSTHRCFMNFFTCGGVQCPRVQPRQPQGVLRPLN